MKFIKELIYRSKMLGNQVQNCLVLFKVSHVLLLPRLFAVRAAVVDWVLDLWPFNLEVLSNSKFKIILVLEPDPRVVDLVLHLQHQMALGLTFLQINHLLLDLDERILDLSHFLKEVLKCYLVLDLVQGGLVTQQHVLLLTLLQI